MGSTDPREVLARTGPASTKQERVILDALHALCDKLDALAALLADAQDAE